MSEEDGDDDDDLDELDHVASLERSAHTTLYLVQQLRASTAKMSEITTPHAHHHSDPSAAAAAAAADPTSEAASPAALPSMRTPLPDDAEKAKFLMKLAPRIRRLESDAVRSLTARLEKVLEEIEGRVAGEREREEEGGVVDGAGETTSSFAAAESRELLMVGHCLRGLALLGRGREAESAFARVAIMPLVRTKVSMGRLDEGGSRGECAGLSSLLDEVAASIGSTFGGVLRLSESMFDVSTPSAGVDDDDNGKATTAPVEVDLVTAGVWIPIATALMADPAVKMAIFSPGIASVLQANYSALDAFVSELAGSLLRPPSAASSSPSSVSAAEAESPVDLSGLDDEYAPLYYRPTLSPRSVAAAQSRIHSHPMTVDFERKWNLPIYYQLRFGECTSRLDAALERTRREGWEADVFSGATAAAELREKHGFELPLFLELYDCLLWLWRPDVAVRPLSHRFLRGVAQIVGRFLAYARDGLGGSIRFGEIVETPAEGDGPGPGAGASATSEENGEFSTLPAAPPKMIKTDNTYCWGERIEDVAAVAWDLTVLESCLTSHYAEFVSESALCPPPASSDARGGGGRRRSSNGVRNPPSELDELRSSSRDLLAEASLDVAPLVDRCWNDVVVAALTSRCKAPLSAVRGVAATYRMTNRPPPSQASPFVGTVLRPLTEFDESFSSRTPPRVGDRWKYAVVSSVADAYANAVEELLSTVERTEMALKSRKTAMGRRAGGVAAKLGMMSDGEKVRLQLYLDQQEFARRVEEAGVAGAKIRGLGRLAELTASAEALHRQASQRNGR
eukprot:CAMPEP_0113572152 /NCGR_PEP_ID=MMETSP0015_2-20120614/25941_1 /TAXON_ID=2838 /ORGANISM="Odontella" /LENGTH=794 /DNA_ID=CAMNT_0000475163 /DNA_START=3 /DNA_END=2387 /DNA_ORIENTATION=- /assembly_acc=CAM_ASM_000160